MAKIILMQRLGAFREAHSQEKYHELLALGYEVVSEKEVRHEAKEVEVEAAEDPEVVSDSEEPLEEYTVKELRAMLGEAGVAVPSGANKEMLVDIAKANGL